MLLASKISLRGGPSRSGDMPCDVCQGTKHIHAKKAAMQKCRQAPRAVDIERARELDPSLPSARQG